MRLHTGFDWWRYQDRMYYPNSPAGKNHLRLMFCNKILFYWGHSARNLWGTVSCTQHHTPLPPQQNQLMCRRKHMDTPLFRWLHIL
jgi:hypothetical protein